MSKTWLIFEDGSYYSLDCSLHKAPKGHPKPVDSYLVTEHEGDFTIAARKAVHAVYDFAVSRGIEVEPVVAGFDLSERTTLDSGLTGQSGGLSFAVSFSQKLFRIDPGNVAATGGVEAGGRISPVKGVETKIRTAASLVKQNGTILFPSRNVNDLSEELIKDLKRRKIRYLPVDNLDEVFDALFQLGPVRKQADVKKVILALLFLLFCGAVFGVWLLDQDKDLNLLDPSSGLKFEKVTTPDSPASVLSLPQPSSKKLPKKKTHPVPEELISVETNVPAVPEKEKEIMQILPAKAEKQEFNYKEDLKNFKKSDDKGFD